MKAIWKEILMALVMGMLLPGIVVDLGIKFQSEQAEPEATAAETVHNNATVIFRQGEAVEQMEMDTYLTGVLLAEMPGNFDLEALKAQSVASRTYTLKALSTGGKHGDGSICGEAGCCQAYISREDYLARGGTEETLRRMSAAVEATGMEVLTYGGDLIEATYFSCSGGQTEDAVAVWGTEVPYLQSTPSPGEEGAAHYEDTLEFTVAELSEKLGVSLSGGDWLGAVTYTSGAGVDTIYLGGKSFKGTQLRSLLGLRSTNFEIRPQGEVVRIRTRGFGHRVGMSQYGAEAMAVAGSSYKEILSHYYCGTTLVHWEN